MRFRFIFLFNSLLYDSIKMSGKCYAAVNHLTFLRLKFLESNRSHNQVSPAPLGVSYRILSEEGVIFYNHSSMLLSINVSAHIKYL